MFSQAQTKAQEVYPDTALKNSIRLNLTPLLVTSSAESATLGYERIIGNQQSFSINLGHLSLPALVTTEDGSPVEWISNLRNTGFIASADYRFYFKRNRYFAPDGLYWGPYAAYYYIDKASRINLIENEAIQGTAVVQTYFNMFNVGLQLGYQFVFWDRWTLDLVLLGPGMGFYSGQVSLDPDVQLSDDKEYLQGVFDALKEIYPGAATLIQDQEINSKGDFNFRALGYRMVVQFGYRF